jgi:hypothetical protein
VASPLQGSQKCELQLELGLDRRKKDRIKAENYQFLYL